ncbi:MAG: SAF domain-containing protein [Candidatus Obscuribacterales bacterium]|nr:SAF domain-containing protein [Candidatus Obscuribacterales bacterium]
MFKKSIDIFKGTGLLAYITLGPLLILCLTGLLAFSSITCISDRLNPKDSACKRMLANVRNFVEHNDDEEVCAFNLKIVSTLKQIPKGQIIHDDAIEEVSTEGFKLPPQLSLKNEEVRGRVTARNIDKNCLVTESDLLSETASRKINQDYESNPSLLSNKSRTNQTERSFAINLVFSTIVLMLAGTAIAALLVSQSLIIKHAFKTNFLLGIACLLVPLVIAGFDFFHWQKIRRPFNIGVASCCLIGVLIGALAPAEVQANSLSTVITSKMEKELGP